MLWEIVRSGAWLRTTAIESPDNSTTTVNVSSFEGEIRADIGFALTAIAGGTAFVSARPEAGVAAVESGASGTVTDGPQATAATSARIRSETTWNL